jgi:hypothetical protein
LESQPGDDHHHHQLLFSLSLLARFALSCGWFRPLPPQGLCQKRKLQFGKFTIAARKKQSPNQKGLKC